MDDAIRKLHAAGVFRKALIVVRPEARVDRPPGIQVIRTTQDMVQRWIVQVSNEYVAGFMAGEPDAPVEVNIRQPGGLPALKVSSPR